MRNGMKSVWLTLAMMLAHAAMAQGWVPQRNVEFIVPSGAGGNLDGLARPMERIWQELKLVPVSSTVVNRTGGEQTIAYNYLNQHAGDPHYLGIATAALLTSHVSGRLPMHYKDLTPIAFLLTDTYIFSVRADSPIKNGKDFVEALKKRPDSVSIAIGSLTHRIAIGLVLQSANIDIKSVKIVVINASGATSAAGGHVDMIVTGLVQTLPHLESGKLRAIAVSSPKRMSGALASVPTWEEQGYKRGTYQAWRGIVAPKGVTPPQVAYWENVMRKVTESPEFTKLAEKNQWEVDFKGAAEMGRLLDAEYAETKSAMTYLGLAK